MSVGFIGNPTGIRAGLGPLVERLAAAAATHDAEGSFPHEAFEPLWRHGVLGLVTPTEVGGAGGGAGDAVRTLVELGTGDPSVALVVALHLLQHAQLAFDPNAWPPAVRNRLQTSLQDAPALVNALRVEPELGTPARGGLPATIAHRRPDGSFALEGRKIYSTGAPGLRWMVVYARTDDAEPLVGQFVLDAAACDGWRIEPTWNHLGMRATASHDVVFDGAVVAADAAVGLRPAAAPVAPDPLLMAWNSLLVAAVYHGVAVAARDWLTGYLHRRVPAALGRSLATVPRFEEAVGRIESRVRTAGRLLVDTADRLDGDDDERRSGIADAAITKLTVTTAAIEGVSEAVALVGNPALSRDNDLERHLRNVLCARIHTPQDDMILSGVGRAALAAVGRAR